MPRKPVSPATTRRGNPTPAQTIERMANGRGIVLDSTRDELVYRWLDGESIRDIQRRVGCLSTPAIEYEIRREMRRRIRRAVA